MQYISTRGDATNLKFEDCLFSSLASDGGLFMPVVWPNFANSLEAFSKLTFQDSLIKIIANYLPDGFDNDILEDIVYRAYSGFRHPEIVAAKEFKYENLKLVELFHGPTWAFKDIALQLLAELMLHFKKSSKNPAKKTIILVATSGDTGSSAMRAFENKEGFEVVVLYPHERVSEIQKLQMTTSPAKNLHSIAILGNFDDTQHIIKQIFLDQEFSSTYNLVAINSINLLRIIIQSAYYFYSYSHFGRPDYFCVPSGNFGNALSGLFAKRMGLPIKKIIVATNINNVLEVAFKKGVYTPKPASSTLSPSMDIQSASNFERYLYLISRGNTQLVKNYYQELTIKKSFNINSEILKDSHAEITAVSASEMEVKKIIHDFHKKHQYVLDPHTAVGVSATQKLGLKNAAVLATAHPAKFYGSVRDILQENYELPSDLQELLKLEPKFMILQNSIPEIKNFIQNLIHK